MRRLALPLLLLFAFAAAPQSVAADKAFIVGGSRPVKVQLPPDTSKPSPLLIMLHSASTSGAHQERYMKLGPVAKKLGMIYIAPDGTVGADGRRVWNAAKSCCQRSGTPVDDIGYIKSLINDIDAKYPVDRSRIYFVGHSNGGFMSLAFACTTGEAAGVVSLAGAMDLDGTCATTKPFALLAIHGDADKTIKIGGGNFTSGNPYTSADQTIRRIAAVNKCAVDKSLNLLPAVKDFDPTIAGKETAVGEFQGCQKPVIFWKISGGAHSPKLPKDYAQQILTFLARQNL